MKIEVVTPLSWLPVHQMHGTKWWLVLDDQTYEIILDGVKHTFKVPAGYRYDRATIWWEGVITKDSLGCQGPLVHDMLCRYHGQLPEELGPCSDDPFPAVCPKRVFTRPEADAIFYAVMIADGISKWRAWAARQAVRLARNWTW